MKKPKNKDIKKIAKIEKTSRKQATPDDKKLPRDVREQEQLETSRPHGVNEIVLPKAASSDSHDSAAAVDQRNEQENLGRIMTL